MSVEISKLTIDVDGTKVEYTLEPARELWVELNKYFGVPITITSSPFGTFNGSNEVLCSNSQSHPMANRRVLG